MMAVNIVKFNGTGRNETASCLVSIFFGYLRPARASSEAASQLRCRLDYFTDGPIQKYKVNNT